MEISPDGEFKMDWNHVVSLWKKHSDPDLLSHFSIQKIVALKNDRIQQTWERLHACLQLQIQNPVFKEVKWFNKDHQDQRKKILQRLELFQINKDQGVYVIPLWHGTQNDKVTLDSICSTGFASLGSTDKGFFGKGIYGTPQAEYSARVYGHGVCLLCFAFVGNVFPIVNDDMKSLLGSSNFENCDAHFAPVVPRSSTNPHETVYFAMKPNDEPVYDELVIFNRTHIVPRYIVYYDHNF